MFTEKLRPKSALVVDDNVDTREFVGNVLMDQGCDVYFALDGHQALTMARQMRPDVVYLDVNMPEQDGWLVCAKLKFFPGSPAVVLMTGSDRGDLFRFAEFVRANNVLQKPFSANEVIGVLPRISA